MERSSPLLGLLSLSTERDSFEESPLRSEESLAIVKNLYESGAIKADVALAATAASQAGQQLFGDHLLRNLRSGVRDRYRRSWHRCPALVRHVSDDSAAGILSGYCGRQKFQSDGAQSNRRSEIMHFQTWQDTAGNATNITDGDLAFPNLNSGVDPNNGKTGSNIANLFQTNLIMPERTFFVDPSLGPVSITRATSTQQGGAVASVVSFVDDGLFLDPATNKNTGIVNVLMRLAEKADEARRKI